jgi:hypothetical protein
VGTVTAWPDGVTGRSIECDAVAGLLVVASIGARPAVSGPLGPGVVHPASRPAATSTTATDRHRRSGFAHMAPTVSAAPCRAVTGGATAGRENDAGFAGLDGDLGKREGIRTWRRFFDPRGHRTR